MDSRLAWVHLVVNLKELLSMCDKLIFEVYNDPHKLARWLDDAIYADINGEIDMWVKTVMKEAV